MNDIKKDDEIYCPECGKPVKKNAVACPYCATKLYPHKSKTVSVLLAVFLGFWSWLYTFRKDKIKFWIFLGSWFPFYLINILGLLNSNFNIANGVPSYGSTAIMATGWVWAIIDAARRPASFFTNYPNYPNRKVTPQVTLCPHCGFPYKPVDYDKDTPCWICDGCGRVLPKT